MDNPFNCKICSLPLLAEQVPTPRQTHKECEVCYLCKLDVSHEYVEQFIAGKVDYLGHITCHEQYMRDEIEKRPITVTQGLLDYLNEKSLMCTPNLNRSIEDNQSLAESAGRKVWLHMTSLEEKYTALKMMQAVTAAWSVLLSNDKAQLNILIKREEFTIEREKRNSEKMAEVEQYRVSEQRKTEIKREKKTPDWKAVQGLIATGAFTEESARAFLKEQKDKQRSATKEDAVN